MTGNKLLESEYNSPDEDDEDYDEIKNGISLSGNNKIFSMNKSNDVIDEHKLSAEL